MSQSLPQHTPQVQFDVLDDSLQIGGLSLTRVAQRVGSTPFYVYDRKAITQRVALLRRHLPPEIQIHYAVKANPMPAVVQHLAGLVDGFDVASGGELRLALDTIINPKAISFAGPGKSDADLSSAIAAGVTLNVESESELERIARIAAYLQIRPRVALRINPDFELKSSGMKMGGGATPFGVDAERAPIVLAQIGKMGMDFQGLHIYPGSQNLNASAICQAQEKAFDLALRLSLFVPSPIRTLNIGGGFGVPYFPGEQPLDLMVVATNLSRLMSANKKALPDVSIVIELGRYLVAEAGLYVCRVIERKSSRGRVYLVTDGGLHHHLAASGNFGQVIRKNYPVLIGNKVRGHEREVVSVVGPLCTPLDVLADQLEMAKAEEGDLVVVLQSGAYGLSVSPTRFLGHPSAIEVMV